MRRPCARPTCSFPATASVLIDLVGHAAELVDLAEPALGHHHLCGRHAASTTVPVGWKLIDSRSPQITLWTELPDDEARAEVRVLHPVSGRSTVAATREPLPFGGDPEGSPVGFEPHPEEVFARQADSDESEALAAALAAATPLLNRAFSEFRAS